MEVPGIELVLNSPQLFRLMDVHLGLAPVSLWLKSPEGQASILIHMNMILMRVRDRWVITSAADNIGSGRFDLGFSGPRQSHRHCCLPSPASYPQTPGNCRVQQREEGAAVYIYVYIHIHIQCIYVIELQLSHTSHSMRGTILVADNASCFRSER